MNKENPKYRGFALVAEMLETAEIVRDFNPEFSNEIINAIKASRGMFIAAEGSSRIFPAQNAIYNSMALNSPYLISSEGAMQSMEYALNDYYVFGVSNSGKTKEVVQLFTKLQSEKHTEFMGVACHQAVALEELGADFSFIDCGEEKAVAATKSVICQALFFDVLTMRLLGQPMPDMSVLSEQIKLVLEKPIDTTLVQDIANAKKVYFCGRNNGVAEELALKTNEITRQQSAFLPGTFLLHGIEEVITPDDTIVLIEPFADELEKIKRIYCDEIGAKVIAISSEATPFKTISLPEVDALFKGYIALVAGWSLLVEAGIERGVDLDKPVRARKIGNEFQEGKG